MSDDDRDIDVDSDDGEDSDSRQARQSGGNQFYSQVCGSNAEKRAHHNALERKRRDHIKDSFSSLRDSVPDLSGEKVQASRAQILKKAADYILQMRTRNSNHQQDIEDLRRQNNLLESQIRKLEKAKATGNFGIDGVDVKAEYNESESDTSDMDEANNQKQAKKMKIAYH